MTRSSLSLVLASVLVVACGGGSSYGTDGDAPKESPPPAASSETPPAATSSSPVTPPPPPASTGGNPVADAGAPASDAGADASTDAGADASPPTFACLDQPTTGGFWLRCNAAAATITKGGTITPGTYLLTRYYDSATCAFEFGTAEVFVDGGKLYMRYARNSMATAGAAPPFNRGTYAIGATAAGDITLTDACAAPGGLAHAVRTGSYQQTATQLVFVLGGVTETWTLQPPAPPPPPPPVLER